jgi:hypothetical protein
MTSNTNTEAKNLVRHRRAKLMGGASAALIANLLPVVAHAGLPPAGARVSVSADGHSDMQGHVVVGSSAPQTTTAAIAATVEGATAGIERVGTSSGNTDTVSTNIISAKAGANSFANGDDTIMSSIGSEADDGIALSGVSINSGTVTSDVTESSTSVSLTNATSGQATNSGNTISAATIINTGTSTIGGSAPVGYQPSASARGVLAGSTFDSESGSLVDARGLVVVSTVQQSLNSGASAARVSDSRSSLRLNSTGNSTYAGDAALDTNSIAADFAGNQARNSVSLDSDTPGFTGSASIANVQQFDGTDFLDDVEAPEQASASVHDTGIYARLDNTFEEEVASSTTLTGSLSVTGNKIGSTARGNQVLAPTSGTPAYGNQIKLADGQSFASNSLTDDETVLGGTGAAALTDLGSRPTGIAAADLAIANTQSLTDVEGTRGVTALTSDNDVWADVQAVTGGSATMADNTISAAATGNIASSGIVNGANAATFAGSAAIANSQSNRGVAVAAETDDAEVGLWSDDYSESVESGTLNSQLSVTGNNLTSSAHGNDAAQVISLTATTLGNGSAPGQAGLFGVTEAIANGTAAIVNKQDNQNAPTSAYTDGEVTLDVEGYSDASNSALSVAANQVEAVATGSTVSNSLTLASTSMQGGAGIASVQSNANSPVLARTYADIEGEVDNDLQDGSTLSVTNNLARAIGYGNSATNTVSATTGNLTIDQVDGNIPLGMATGAIAAANNQFSASAVTAELEAYTDADVEDDVLGGSKLVNSNNTFVAAAYGNHAANTASLSLGTLQINPTMTSDEEISLPTPGHMASLGSLVNLQSASNTIAATTDYSDVYTDVDDDVRASSIDSSNNVMQSIATANRTDSNSLTITGTNLTDADNYRAGLQLVDDDGRFASKVYNAQTSAANVLAQTLATEKQGSYPGVEVYADGDIDGSGVTVLANRQIANATANAADNALSLSGTTVKTTSGLQNVQESSGAVTAQLGYAGAPALPGTSAQAFNYTVEVSSPSGYCADGFCAVNGGTARISTANLSTAQVAVLLNEGWSQGEGELTRNASYLGTMSIADFQVLGASNKVYSSQVPGTPPTSGYTNASGAAIETYGDVENSVLRVADNVGAAAATGNSASNVLKVAATTLSADGSNGFAYAGKDADYDSESGGTAGVQADHGIINSQSITGPVSASSYGAYVIRSYGDDEEGSLYAEGSTLDVSRNQQSATAFGNTATTSLTAAAGTTDGDLSAGLLSTQTSSGSVSTVSDLQAFAPVVSSGSTTTLNDNTNTATAVANDAKNSVSASATNFADAEYGYASTREAEGNLALRNEQTTTGAPVTAAATTTIANQESPMSVTGVRTGLDGVRSGTVAMNGNSTLAQAAANQATNSVALNVAAGQGGASALSSSQNNASAVTSNAASTIGVELTANGESEYGALNASGLTITGNSTVANARGNAAVNTATANGYGQSEYPAYAGSGYADARDVVLNSQSNSAAISATATSTDVAQALNGAMVNSVAAVGGNTTLASAYGNAATNTLTVTPIANGVPSGAVSNSQYNSGAVTARVTSVTYSAGVAGAVTDSSMGVTANTIGATAVGNNAVSTITTGR